MTASQTISHFASDSLEYPFQPYLLKEKDFVHVRHALDELDRRFGLSAEYPDLKSSEKIHLVVSEYLRFCSWPKPFPEALTLVSQLTYLILFLGDQMGSDSDQACLEDLSRVLRGCLPREERPSCLLACSFLLELRDYVGSAGACDRFVTDFLDAVSGLARNLERDQAPSRVDEYLAARIYTICVFPYLSIWRLLTGFPQALEHRLDRSLRGIDRTAAQIIAMANDLCSVPRDLETGHPNLVLILASQEGITVVEAAVRSRARHQVLVHRFDEQEAFLRQDEGSNQAVEDYLNFLRSCIAGNLATMRALPRRYQELAETRSRNVRPEKAAKDSDRLQGARSFLVDQWRMGGGRFPCYTSESRDFRSSTLVTPEVFSTITALELVEAGLLSVDFGQKLARRLRGFVNSHSTIHFFEQPELLPADVDCTALGLLMLQKAGASNPSWFSSGVDKILTNIDRDGVICVYMDAEEDRRNIRDAVVCANALRWIHHQEQGHRSLPTEDFVYRCLTQGKCLTGTRYYPSEQTFLFRVSQLMATFPRRFSHYREPLIERLQAHDVNRLSLMETSHRALALGNLGLCPREELESLRQAQLTDGSWPADAYYRYGRSGIFFGSPVLSTLFCLWALGSQD